MHEHGGSHDHYKCGNCNMVMETHTSQLVLRCGWCGSTNITFTGHY